MFSLAATVYMSAPLAKPNDNNQHHAKKCSHNATRRCKSLYPSLFCHEWRLLYIKPDSEHLHCDNNVYYLMRSSVVLIVHLNHKESVIPPCYHLADRRSRHHTRFLAASRCRHGGAIAQLAIFVGSCGVNAPAGRKKHTVRSACAYLGHSVRAQNCNR